MGLVLGSGGALCPEIIQSCTRHLHAVLACCGVVRGTIVDSAWLARAGAKDDVEESGWKMVSRDVFRSPKDATLLCVQLGSGVQIILSAFITLFFAALGAPSSV